MGQKIDYQDCDTAYADLKKKLIKEGYNLESAKKIQHGIQFNVSKGGKEDLIRVFTGKKGTTLDCSQASNEIIKKAVSTALNASSESTESKAKEDIVARDGKIYSLCVGINDFENSKSLRYAERDAEVLHQLLVENFGIGEGAIKLVGPDASLRSITESIEKIKKITTAKDTVILFFATHGEFRKSNDTGEFYIITADTDINNLYGTALSMDTLKKLVSQISTENKLILLDTCHSGGICTRTSNEDEKDSKELDAKERQKIFEKFHTDDIVIITSCLANEKSIECDELQHGVFSYYLLSGLTGAVGSEEGMIDLYYLYTYINDYVKKYVKEKESISQTPKFFGNIKGPIMIPKMNDTRKKSNKKTVAGSKSKKLSEFIQKPLDNDEVKLNFETMNCIGIDESGKGDYFGPLVVAAVYVENQEKMDQLIKLGVMDCKKIKDISKLNLIAQGIRKICDNEIIWFWPNTYNMTYPRMRNLNHMVAWAHAKSLEKVLTRNPDCQIALSDQFASKDVLIKELKEKGRRIQLIQRPKAEENKAVAAASILARAKFIEILTKMEKMFNHKFPKGADTKVIEEAADFAIKGGKLFNVAKLHFKTTDEVKAVIKEKKSKTVKKPKSIEDF